MTSQSSRRTTRLHKTLFDTEGNVVSAGTLENNVAMNPWPAEYYTAEENIVGDDTSPWNIYDFTILPQDYPPA